MLWPVNWASWRGVSYLRRLPYMTYSSWTDGPPLVGLFRLRGILRTVRQ